MHYVEVGQIFATALVETNFEEGILNLFRAPAVVLPLLTDFPQSFIPSALSQFHETLQNTLIL